MPRFISYLLFGLFFVSLSSGVIILLAYHPSDAFNSVQKINYLIPYGNFFRKLHYFSSEIFTFFLLLHVGFELSKKMIKIDSSSWNYSVIGFMLVFILMFTGFVLKADLSANGAAEVTYNLIKNTPVLNHILNLIQDKTVFYYKFFIWHILFLPAILIYAIYRHTKTLHVKIEYISIAFGITLLSAFFISMPRDIVPTESINNLTSPWFFFGAENLLQKAYAPSIINLILLMPIFLLFVYNYMKNKIVIKILLLLWLIAYTYISWL